MWECAGRKGSVPFHVKSVEKADSNAHYFLKETFFHVQDLNRITCQGPVPSLTIKENLFRENHFIEQKKNVFGTFEIP